MELKNSQARMNLRFLNGNFNLADKALSSSTLNINQRMTLDEQELQGLSRNLAVGFASVAIGKILVESVTYEPVVWV